MRGQQQEDRQGGERAPGAIGHGGEVALMVLTGATTDGAIPRDEPRVGDAA
jgi:hypothetical protein